MRAAKLTREEWRKRVVGVFVCPCECTAMTEKAIKVRSYHEPIWRKSDGDRPGEEWIPLSQLHEDNEVNHVGTRGKLIVKRWFAEQVGWIEEEEP